MNDYQHLSQVPSNSIRKLSTILDHIKLKMIDMTGRSVWDNPNKHTFTIHADLTKKGKWSEKDGVVCVFDEKGHPWMCQTPDNDKLSTNLTNSGYEKIASAHPIKNVQNAKIDDKNIWDFLPTNKPKKPAKPEMQVVEHAKFLDWIIKRTR